MKILVILSHMLATLAVMMTVCAPVLVPATAEAARRGVAACGREAVAPQPADHADALLSGAEQLPWFARPSGVASWSSPLAVTGVRGPPSPQVPPSASSPVLPPFHWQVLRRNPVNAGITPRPPRRRASGTCARAECTQKDRRVRLVLFVTILPGRGGSRFPRHKFRGHVSWISQSSMPHSSENFSCCF